MLSKKYDDKPVFCRISLCKLLNILNQVKFFYIEIRRLKWDISKLLYILTTFRVDIFQNAALAITFRRYITFAHPDLRRGWRGFCNRGVFEKILFSYLVPERKLTFSWFFIKKVSSLSLG